eukprot:scaffold10717_cov61-Phaeocystis_antarctica.AAC.2
MPYATPCAAQARLFLSIWLGLCSRAGARAPPLHTSRRTACPPHSAPHGAPHGAPHSALHSALQVSPATPLQVSPATTRINKPLLALTLVRLGFTPQRGRRLAAITNPNLDPDPYPNLNLNRNRNPDPGAGWRRSATHSTCSARPGRLPAMRARARNPRRGRPDRCLSRSR